MVAEGGFVAHHAPLPGSLGARVSRVVTILAATILLVQVFALCVGGILVCGAFLLGFPLWFAEGLAIAVALASVGIGAMIFARAWRSERELLRGGAPGG